MANGALQTRDRHKFGDRNGPGSAAHHFVLRRVRGTSTHLAPPRRLA